MTRTLTSHLLTLSVVVAALGACHGPVLRIEPRLLPELVTELAPGDLAGFVLDSVTGLPIANASITLGKDSSAHVVPLAPPVGAVTDSLGRFRLRAIHPGVYTLVARFIGYRTRLLSVRLTDSTGAVVTLGLGRSYFSCPENMPKGALCY